MDFIMFLFHGAGSIISFIGTVFWIAMMIDCLRRSNMQHKGRWMIFMLITNWVGAVVYFFVVRPTILDPVFKFLHNMLWSSRSSSVWQQPVQAQTRTDPPASTPYRDYQQGYQPQEPLYQPPVSAYQAASQATPEQSASHPMYEQPQAEYPEMPPMQQQ